MFAIQSASFGGTLYNYDKNSMFELKGNYCKVLGCPKLKEIGLQRISLISEESGWRD